MRREVMILLAGLVVGLAAPAGAQPAAPQPAAPQPPAHRSGDFWEWVIDPHGEEIQVTLAKARQNRQQAINQYPDYDYQGFNQVNRTITEKLLADARNMLRYALTLQPDHPDVLLELGLVTDDLERTDEARAALVAYLETQLPERIDPNAHFRLGRLLAKQRDWEAATVQLRRALSSQSASVQRREALRCLASVLMETGRVAEAIELLRSASDPASPDLLLEFTLAVAYDRDEQLTRAHEVLDRLLAGNRYGGSLVQAVTQQPYQRGALLFVPAVDRYYYYGLLYEVSGELSEARTEWLTYARADGARFAQRALAHVAAVDALLAERLAPPRSRGGKK